MSPINLEVQLTYKDFRDLIKFERFTVKGANFWINNFLWLVFGGLAIVSIANTTNKFLIITFTLIIAFIIFVFFSQIYSYYKIKKGWQRNTVWHHPIHYEFSDSGVKASTIYGKDDISWEGIFKVHEGDGYFTIILLNDFFHLIPKRTFKDIAQIEEFKSLLTEKVDGKFELLEKRLKIGVKNESTKKLFGD